MTLKKSLSRKAVLICGGLSVAILAPTLALASADDNTREMASAIARMGSNLGGEMGIGGGLAWMGFWIGAGLALGGASQR
jgi:hypothetical protein